MICGLLAAGTSVCSSQHTDQANRVQCCCFVISLSKAIFPHTEMTTLLAILLMAAGTLLIGPVMCTNCATDICFLRLHTLHC